MLFQHLVVLTSAGSRSIPWPRTSVLKVLNRGPGDEISAVRASPSPGTAPATKSSSCVWKYHASRPLRLKFAEDADKNHAEIKGILIWLPGWAPYIRILGDLEPYITGEVDDGVVLAALRRLVPLAEEKGVTLLVETNGVYTDTARLCRLLDEVASDAVAALWDLHHPYRFAGEKPEKTVQNLGAYIKYVHIKDSVVENGSIRYRMMGEGDLPIDDMMLALRSINYDGYISLEWVKRWAEDLDDAGVVFPNFANYMSRFSGVNIVKGHLFENNARTGKYIWQKYTLIDLTFPQVLDRVVEEFPDQYAFKYTTQDYTRTYAEFRDDVDTFARSLIALGVRPGDHVAIWATNVPQWFITFWAPPR